MLCSDDYGAEDDTVSHNRKESNYTVLTINDIMDEQMSQINRIAEVFEVRSSLPSLLRCFSARFSLLASICAPIPLDWLLQSLSRVFRSLCLP